MRILVCGGRNYASPFIGGRQAVLAPDERRAAVARSARERTHLFAALTAVHKRVGIDEIIHGAARGADSTAGQWAQANGVTETRFPIDHSLDGPWPQAGVMRNIRMFRESKPDMVIAFPGGNGTAHMVKHAREWRCSVWEDRG